MYVQVLAPLGYKDRFCEISNGTLRYGSELATLKGTIKSLELISQRDFEERTFAGTASAGILGGVLAGPLGAIGGMLFGGRKREINDLTLSCSLENGLNFILKGGPDLFTTLKTLQSLPKTSEKSVSGEVVREKISVSVSDHESNLTIHLPKDYAKLRKHLSKLKISEIAEKLNVTERSVTANLIRFGIVCADYDGASKKLRNDNWQKDRGL